MFFPEKSKNNAQSRGKSTVFLPATTSAIGVKSENIPGELCS